MRFKDKVVLVLGGNSGMGLASAQAFAAEGGKVHLTGRDQATIDAAVASIPGSTGYRSDIADIAATEAVVAQVEAADGRIDVLYINAGVGGFAPLRGITPEDWDHVHSINLKGCVFALQKAIRIMGKGGAIVVTGSIGAHGALEGNGTYAAAKGGLKLLMQTLAQELAPQGIRVNAIAPGAIKTAINRPAWQDPRAEAELLELIPYGRVGEPEDVAKAAVWLASDDADYVVGATLFVDGAMTRYPAFREGG